MFCLLAVAACYVNTLCSTTLQCTIGQRLITTGCGYKYSRPPLTTHTVPPSDKHFCCGIRPALFVPFCHILVWMICLKKIFAVFSPILFRGRLVLGNFPSTQENHLAPQYWFQNNIQTTFTDKFKVCWI